MFEFTKRSRKILELLAQAEGKRLNSDLLGPEHILIALLNDEDSVAARIMKNLGINFDRLKKEIEQSIKQNGTTIILGKVPISTGYKRVIEISKEEAKKLKNNYIGTEHLLLAIFKEGSCFGLSSLIKAGIDYNVIRSEILRVLGVKVNSEKSSNLKTGNKPSALEEFTHDLTKMAEAGLLDPVIGRNDEIERVIRILSRKRKNNPILIGEAGVGKTAIVEGLAQRVVEKQVSSTLQESRVLSLDMAAIVAGTKYRGEFEDRLKRVVKEINEEKSVIVFIDELHTIIGAGAAEGAIDAANILKPALARGELQCIGATTLNEFRMYIEKDAALVRRFQSILVDEPDIDDTIEILKGLRSSYEEHHKVRYTDTALIESAILAERYIHDRFLPDKAIDIIDEAGAMARLSNRERPSDIDTLDSEIDLLNKRKNELVLSQEYEQAASIRDVIIEKKEVLNSKLSDWIDKKNEYEVVVDAELVASIVSESTGIPVENLEESMAEKLLRIENELHRRIIGQDDAISAISKSIRRTRAGLSSYDRPSGSFIFLGPTGVGKSELAKALAEFLFEDEKNLIRLDMSEYMEKHSVSRLIGAPPGYIGYEEGGQLTEKVKRRPYSVILFDEIEKAHPDLFNILLQVLEEGELTDGSGATVSFRDVIIILTSNIGNRNFQKGGKLGFKDQDLPDNDNFETISDEFNRLFNPEFVNRIDEVIYFHKLDRKHVKEIVKIMLDEIREKLLARNIEIKFSSSVLNYISDIGYDEKFGARNIRKVIQRDLEDNLAVELLKGKFNNAKKIQAVMKGKKIAFRIKEFLENDTKAANDSGEKNEESIPAKQV
jgi:ATP-dependent Clp protease ATP-binding subunit ClpC